MQPRLLVAEGAMDSYCEAVQLVSAVHARSVVAVLAVLSYSPATQVVSVAHWRSLEAPGAAVWYCDEAEHVLTALQVRSDVPEAGADSY